MYGILLILHNLLRWLVLLAGLLAVLRALIGWIGRRPWGDADRKAGMVYTIGLDLQFLLGLALTFTSPLIRAALADLPSAMRVNDLRFFPLEHLPLMLVALILAHVGSGLARRAPSPSGQHLRAALWFGVSLLAILAAIPWWRPLLRGA